MATRPRNKFAMFRDRIMKAHKAGDEEGVSREVSGMIGEMISGTNDELNPSPTNEWEGSPTEKTGEKSVVVHVHAQPHGSNTPLSSAAAPPPQGADAGADPAAAAQPAPSAAAGDPMAQLMQRITTIEQALAQLMQGKDEGGDDDDEEVPTGDAAVEGPKGTGEGNPTEVPFDAENPENVTEGGTGKGEPTNTGEDPGAAPANAPTGDAARVVTTDSRALATGFLEMNKLAAILLPDVKVPTFDAKVTRQQTIDAMCKFRKATLVQAYKNPEIKPHIDSMLDTPPDFKTMSCDAAAALFSGAARIVRDANNARMSNPRPAATRNFGGGPLTPADINKRNRERFGIQR